MCPFFFLLVLSQFLVLFCLVQFLLQKRSAGSHQSVNQVAKSLKLNFNATIRIHWLLSKSQGCQDFVLDLKCYNKRSAGSHQSVNQVAKSLKLNFNATIRIHWFSSKSGGCQDFLFNLKCYNKRSAGSSSNKVSWSSSFLFQI